MQGAIIGGSIGGVALIGVIVGTIALVRWKRYLAFVCFSSQKSPLREHLHTHETFLVDQIIRYNFA